MDSLDVFEDRGEGPVEGNFLAVGEAEDAAFGSGGVGKAEVGDGVVANVSQGGGVGGQFQGYEDGAVVQFEAGAAHVRKEFAAGGVVISNEPCHVVHVLLDGAVPC